jgi:predicted Zn-dependent peptidase
MKPWLFWTRLKKSSDKDKDLPINKKLLQNFGQKKYRRSLGRAVLVVALGASFSWATPPTLPTFPPLEFHPPKPERFVLDNGLIVFLLEDHELPLIRVEMDFHIGTQYDPPEKVGLNSLYSQVLTEGGSLAHSPEDIEKILDKTASGIGFSTELENGSGAMSCRAEDFDLIFGLFTDLILHPQFRKDHVELAKVKSLESLRRMNDDPEDIARREFRGIIYGKSHPYARVPSPDTIGSISRQDLLELHDHYFKPNTSAIAISGDFSSAAMKNKIKSALGSWARGDVVYPALAPVTYTPRKEVYFVQRPINQSQIRIGYTGLERHNPDHFAWELFNELWGSGATSLLFKNIRTRQGLAYAVGSGFSEPFMKGLIVAISQTRGSQTIAAIQSMLQLTQDAQAAPFTAEEIKAGKESIINRFVENYTSSAQIASQIMNNEFFHFPPDYIDTYTAHVAQVRAEDLARVGKTYLHPEQSTLLVVGDLSTFEKPISTVGKAQEIKITDYSQDQ